VVAVDSPQVLLMFCECVCIMEVGQIRVPFEQTCGILSECLADVLMVLSEGYADGAGASASVLLRDCLESEISRDKQISEETRSDDEEIASLHRYNMIIILLHHNVNQPLSRTVNTISVCTDGFEHSINVYSSLRPRRISFS